MEEIKQCKNILGKLSRVLDQISREEELWYPMIQDKLEEALRYSENLTLKMREFYGLDYSPNVNISEKRFKEITKLAFPVDVQIESLDNIWLKIPLICTKKMHQDKYLRDTLTIALAEIFSKPLMLKDRVVVFIYTYDQKHDSNGFNIVDFDNIESRSILNTLTKYILFDDGPQCISEYSCYELGEEKSTTICIMSNAVFRAWINERGNAI